MTSRRSFLFGAAALIAAPAVIRTAGLLMPVKPMVIGSTDMDYQLWDRTLQNWQTFWSIRSSDGDVLNAMRLALVSNGGYRRPRRFVASRDAIKRLDAEIQENARIPMATRPVMYREVYGVSVQEQIIAADWPSRTIKAPPGGFKIERA